jgi:hypothetical protein
VVWAQSEAELGACFGEPGELHLCRLLADHGGVKFRGSILIVVVAVSVVACGRPGDASQPVGDATSSTTDLTSTTLVASTVPDTSSLGVTVDDFVAIWNRLLAVNDFLLVEEFDVHDDARRVRRFSEDWVLELSVNPSSGEVSEAALSGSLDRHTDMAILLAITWVALVDASNASLDLDILEDFDWVASEIGLPSSEGVAPEGFGSGDYSSQGVIEGVLYSFEESGFESVLTARPAP